MSIWDKLINFIYITATSRGKLSQIITLPAGTAFYLIMVAFVFLSLWIDNLLEFPELLPVFWSIILSTPIITLGALLIIWTVVLFIKNRGTPVPFNPPSRLITTAPYSQVRNPMVSGYYLVMFGLGLLLKSVSLFSIFTPLFILLTVIYLKLIEEPELEKRLGSAYEEYRKQVPMFMPRLKRANSNANR